MPEMLSPGAALIGAGLGEDCPLITDGRQAAWPPGCFFSHKLFDGFGLFCWQGLHLACSVGVDVRGLAGVYLLLCV
jgi:hypothetical protein